VLLCFSVELLKNLKRYNITSISFSDYVFKETDTTNSLYEKMAKPLVKSWTKGISGTIFAYGQTSSGKTHTIIGSEEEPGIARLAFKDIFEEISKYPERIFLVRLVYHPIHPKPYIPTVPSFPRTELPTPKYIMRKSMTYSTQRHQISRF
jgi:hypothetical protein